MDVKTYGRQIYDAGWLTTIGGIDRTTANLIPRQANPIGLTTAPAGLRIVTSHFIWKTVLWRSQAGAPPAEPQAGQIDASSPCHLKVDPRFTRWWWRRSKFYWAR
jgi:hypothetical protein